MATSSRKSNLAEVGKISLSILEAVSGEIPPPGEAIVKLVSQVVAAVETAKRNQDLWNQLRDLLLSIVPVVFKALDDSARGKTTPPDLKQSVEELYKTLETILEKVKEVQSNVKSKRLRRKIVAVFFGNANADKLKGCCEDLDWAMKKFDVKARLGDAVRLCEVLEKTREISARTRMILNHQLLQNLTRAKTAEFDYEHPDKHQNCFEGTRTGILQDIKDWIANTKPGVERIFCLKGIAGVGKSTVARTIAQYARDTDILGAQFFFSRAREAELRNAALVFPTIAYQLARFDPDFGERIIAALEADPDAGTRSFKDQLDKLIIKPLSHIQQDPTRVAVIVFDAFDECEAPGATEILQLLVNAIPKLPIHFKVLITSRPEIHIESILVPSDSHLHITALHDIEEYIVKSDIQLYLDGQLRALGPKHHPPLLSTWITDKEINLLAEKAGNLFIVAATALRFLTEYPDLQGGLELLLQIVSSTHHDSEAVAPFIYLDTLYLGILRGLLTPATEAGVTKMFQSVVGSIVLLRDPLPTDALERLIGLKTSSILSRLQSVIRLPSPNSPDQTPRVYHQSFSDFLQDRCSDPRFRIDNKHHEARMALRCLGLISIGVHKGMLGDLHPTLANSGVADDEGKIKAACPRELQYAYRFWPAHFLAAMDSKGEDSVLVESLVNFVAKDMVPWVEVMSGLGSLRLCLVSLESLNSWATKSSCLSLTKSLLNDAHRMVLAYFPIIDVNARAQNITRSVFPFLPRNCHLRTQYPDYVDSAVTVVSGVDQEWPASLAVLKSHSDTVRSVAFSPAGSRLASASDDKTVHLCDAMGGGSLVVLDHSKGVNCVAFSPNGSLLASGSNDNTIRIWDPLSAECNSVFKGHSASVMSLSFSPDGLKLASSSGTGDQTCRVWDISSARCLLTLHGHSACVRSVAFSRDGLQLASGSDDQTIRVWDSGAGNCLTILHGHSDKLSSVVYFPDGSQIASSSTDKTVRVWDVTRGSCLVTLEGHTDMVYSMAISPDGTRLASGSKDNTIRLWDTTSHTCITILTGHSNAVNSVSFSPDGSRLASGSGDATVRIWDTSIISSPASVQGHSEGVKSVTFSPDGLRVASGSNDKTVRLWDAVTGGIVATLEGHTDWVEMVAFSPDGWQLASGSKDTTVRLWDITTKDCVATIEAQRAIDSIAFQRPSAVSAKYWSKVPGSCRGKFSLEARTRGTLKASPTDLFLTSQQFAVRN